MDPEFPYTLSQLRVLSPRGMFIISLTLIFTGVTVLPDTRIIRVCFTPTVPHCSLSTLIGLAIRFKIEREFLLEAGWTLSIQVYPGTHNHAEEINRQLADKERVYAALENPRLINIIESMSSHRM